MSRSQYHDSRAGHDQQIDPRLTPQSASTAGGAAPYYPSPAPSQQYSRHELPPLASAAPSSNAAANGQQYHRLPPPSQNPYNSPPGWSADPQGAPPRGVAVGLPDRSGRFPYAGESPNAYAYDSGPQGSTAAADGSNADPKRSRACDSCRGLKVRCDPNPATPGTCKRCAKAKRACHVSQPSRKRQKKADSRVAELEKKIDELRAAVEAQKRGDGAGPSTPDNDGSESDDDDNDDNDNDNDDDDDDDASSQDEGRAVTPSMKASKSTDQQKKRRKENVQNGSPTGGQKRRFSDANKAAKASPIPGRTLPVEERDPASSVLKQVDEVLDRETQRKVFDRYVDDMSQHMPAVSYAKGTNADAIRGSKPILFLSILVCAGVGMLDIEIQEELAKMCMGVFADCIIRIGEKSLELIQALELQTLWYRAPQRYEHMNFYQLSHIAAVMAIDVGMGKRWGPSKSWRLAAANVQGQFAKAMLNTSSLEVRRAWLGCYFQCSNVSMSLRRSNLIRWNTYMDESIEMLESSPDALPDDKALCWHVRLQHINEEVGFRFCMDDPSAKVSISDSGVQDALAGFEKELERYRVSVPENVWTLGLEFSMHVADLYMHEVAMHINHNVDDFRAPFTEESIKSATGQVNVLSPAHSMAIKKCLTAVKNIFGAFFDFDIPAIQALPIFYFVRVAYATVVLLKMYFAVMTPGNDIKNVLPPEELQVEEHLTKLCDTFRKIDETGSFRPASKFLIVISKLLGYFQNNKDKVDVIPRNESKFNQWAAMGKANQILKTHHANKEKARRSAKNGASSKSQPSSSETSAQAPVQTPTQDRLAFLSEVATTSASQQDTTMQSPRQQQRQSPALPQQQQQPPPQTQRRTSRSNTATTNSSVYNTPPPSYLPHQTSPQSIAHQYPSMQQQQQQQQQQQYQQQYIPQAQYAQQQAYQQPWPHFAMPHDLLHNPDAPIDSGMDMHLDGVGGGMMTGAPDGGFGLSGFEQAIDLTLGIGPAHFGMFMDPMFGGGTMVAGPGGYGGVGEGGQRGYGAGGEGGEQGQRGRDGGDGGDGRNGGMMGLPQGQPGRRLGVGLGDAVCFAWTAFGPRSCFDFSCGCRWHGKTSGW